VSVVPALTLYQFADPRLIVRSLRWPGLKRHIYLVRRRDQSLSIAAKALHDWLVAHAPVKPPPGSASRRRGHRERRGGPASGKASIVHQ
jgi:DNA-binding transcriptional LysR family regulator